MLRLAGRFSPARPAISVECSARSSSPGASLVAAKSWSTMRLQHRVCKSAVFRATTETHSSLGWQPPHRLCLGLPLTSTPALAGSHTLQHQQRTRPLCLWVPDDLVALHEHTAALTVCQHCCLGSLAARWAPLPHQLCKSNSAVQSWCPIIDFRQGHVMPALQKLKTTPTSQSRAVPCLK